MRSHLSSSLSRQRYRWRNQEALPHLEVARDVEHGQHIDHARIVTELTCRQRHFPQTAQILLGQWMVGASEQSHGVGASHAHSWANGWSGQANKATALAPAMPAP